MKKLLPILFFFTLINLSYSQDYVSKEPIEAISADVIRSDFSVGISPIVFIPVSEYSEGLGFGLELVGLYGLNKNFSVGGFLKIKSEINGGALNAPGRGYRDNEKVFINVAGSGGAIFEYKIFNKVGFNVRLGYEDIVSSTSTPQYSYNPLNGNYITTYNTYDPGFIYGGGISLYLKRDDSKRAMHSFNWGITFESNNFTEFPVLDISTNEFSDTRMNAFYVQFGWRIQFHSLKNK